MNIEQFISPIIFLTLVVSILVMLISFQARKIRKLELGLKLYTEKLDQCSSEVMALLKCEKGIGNRLKQQQQLLRHVIERQDSMEVHDGAGTSYRQAMVLLNKGASTDELIDACDMSRGELDLLSRLNNAFPSNKPDYPGLG